LLAMFIFGAPFYRRTGPPGRGLQYVNQFSRD